MKIKYTPNAIEDIKYWQKKNKKNYARIKLLINDIAKHPFIGLGKPEALKYSLKGKWSRRITREHRIVYELTDEGDIIIYQCRFHY